MNKTFPFFPRILRKKSFLPFFKSIKCTRLTFSDLFFVCVFVKLSRFRQQLHCYAAESLLSGEMKKFLCMCDSQRVLLGVTSARPAPFLCVSRSLEEMAKKCIHHTVLKDSLVNFHNALCHRREKLCSLFQACYSSPACLYCTLAM